MRHFIRTILERLRTKAQPRARQQQTEERKPDEQADDRHVGMSSTAIAWLAANAIAILIIEEARERSPAPFP